MRRIILVTGGQRSGKSTYAEKVVLEMADAQGGDGRAVYMATSRIWDEEFARRVQIHKERRGPQWINIEEPKFLGNHNVEGRVVLVDCVTLWSTNFFFEISTSQENESSGEKGNVVKRSLEAVKDEFDKFTRQDATFVFVTNEIGLSGVSDNKIQRQFTDLLGWLNQYVASKADSVILMVSGIPVKIK